MINQELDAKQMATDEIRRLENEVNVLNEIIASLNERLKESESFKTHFISNITNELLNPFASIIGLSKSILSVSKEEWKKVIAMVALIHSEAFNLDFQLQNMFAAAKIEAGQANLAVMDLNLETFFDTIREYFKIESRKNEVKINYNHSFDTLKPVFFRTDPEKLKLIVVNLLHNALKASPKNSAIDVRATLTDDILAISIKDTGSGIPEEKRKNLFKRFEKLNHQINSVNKGQGLGLSVSLALIDMLDGTISLSGQSEKGSEFVIEIPSINEPSEGISEFDNEFFFDEEKKF